jgi:hypothetical protein
MAGTLKETLNKGCPRFVARFNVPNRFLLPGRAYLHQAGLQEAFGSQDPVGEAGRHFLDVLGIMNRGEIGKRYDFILATIYGDIEHRKSIDCFGFTCLYPWPGNPDISPWVCKNGVFVLDKVTTCGDSMIVLGQEEAHRRACGDIVAYLCNPPKIEVEGREKIEDITLSL